MAKKTADQKWEIVRDAIMEEKIGNLEFVVGQYIAEMGDDYIDELYKELKNKKGIDKVKRI